MNDSNRHCIISNHFLPQFSCVHRHRDLHQRATLSFYRSTSNSTISNLAFGRTATTTTPEWQFQTLTSLSPGLRASQSTTPQGRISTGKMISWNSSIPITVVLVVSGLGSPRTQSRPAHSSNLGVVIARSAMRGYDELGIRPKEFERVGSLPLLQLS
jgi:hypothetical protein